MKYRYLGSTKIKVSEIGFGAWGIGGNFNQSKAYGPTSDEVSSSALLEAIDRGVNFFDTSPLYGFGHSEELIGKTLKKYRDEIIILTKVGYVDFTGKQVFSYNYLKESLELSLRRLKTEYVDILQLHDLPIKFIEDSSEIINCLKDLKKEGKVRFFGISTKTQEESKKIIDLDFFDCMQINFNLMDQRAVENGLFVKCFKNKVGIIVRTPLCFGFLTGKYNSKSFFHKDDHRSLWSKEQVNVWASAYELFLEKLAKDPQQTNAQAALRFCISFNEVSTIIPGMLTKDHVKENTFSSDLGSYSNNVINIFRNIYHDNNFFIKKNDQ